MRRSPRNAFSPATGTGAGLASNVKINGISRKAPSNSTVDVKLIGEVGIVIRNASVRDRAGNLWDLPAEVELDIHGRGGNGDGTEGGRHHCAAR